MSTFELSDEVFNEILRLSRQYHREAEKCRDAKAFLAGCILIGGAFEAMLLSFANCYPNEAFDSISAPRIRGRVKPLIDWSLANLLTVAKERGWLPSALSTDEDWDEAKAQIGDYGEIIKDIRNLVHPARYAIDMPSKRITKKYLEAVFEIIKVAHEHLLGRINESLREAIEKQEVKGA
jgi:hypothetical protein